MARPKKNNAEYFSHDADMRNDVKIKALRRKFSHTGYAVWNYLLETLTDSDYFEIAWEEIDIELLAADYDVSVAELTEIVDYSIKIGLLQRDGDKLLSKAHQQRFASLLANRERKRIISDGQTPHLQGKGRVSASQNPAGTDNSDCNGDAETHSKGKDSTVDEKKGEKNAKTVKRFSPPPLAEVSEYIAKQGYSVSAARFIAYYESNGWKVGRNPMKDWQAAVRSWQQREQADTAKSQTPAGVPLGVGERIENGRRTYGTGKATVPMDAPSRPGDKYAWDSSSQTWILL